MVARTFLTGLTGLALVACLGVARPAVADSGAPAPAASPAAPAAKSAAPSASPALTPQTAAPTPAASPTIPAPPPASTAPASPASTSDKGGFVPPSPVKSDFARKVLPAAPAQAPARTTARPPAHAAARIPHRQAGPLPMRYVVPKVLKSMGGVVPEYTLINPGAPIPASAMTLEEMVAVMRMRHPEAQIIAGFYDWRTVSEYRANAGLHLGYDIAMHEGSVVPAAWPGKVVAITNWLGPQYGITIETNGFRTTYGHLSPLVKEGDIVMAGQPVGTTIIDHVDVKMRNAQGDYVDFGAHQTSEPVALMPPPMVGNPKEMGILKFLIAEETLYQAQDSLKHEQLEANRLHATLRDAVSTQQELNTQLPRMKSYFDQGLVARVDVENAQKKFQTVQGRLKTTKSLAVAADQRLSRAQADLTSARQQLKAVEGENARLGVQTADVVAFVTKYVEKHPTVAQEARQAQAAERKLGSDPVAPATPELAKEKERLEMLERLYQDGAVALHEVEEARARYAALEAKTRR